MREPTQPKLPVDVEAFKQWKPDAQQRALARLKEAENNQWRPFYCPDATCMGEPHGKWNFPHARPDQRPPRWADDWLTLLLSGGRGSGKTRTGSEITHRVSAKVPRIILVAATGPDLRETMVEGRAGILATSPPGKRPDWEPSKKKLTWPNGCVAQGFSAEEPDRLRGPECLVAGTLVETEAGPQPIETILPGQRVWTRGGLRMVTATASKVDEVMTLDRPEGRLTGTYSHPIWTENRGWVYMEFVSPDDTLVTWSPTSPLVAATSSIRPAETRSTTPAGSGNKSTFPFQTDTTSTMSTLTGLTTASRTWSPSPSRTTGLSTLARQSLTSVVGAVRRLRSTEDAPDSGAPLASVRLTENPCVDVTPGASSPSLLPASSAGLSSPLAEGRSAARPASTGIERVYDLTVETDHEFFANGILVHNSAFIWADEPAHYDHVEDVWSNMQFGLRIPGFEPKIIATTTPLPTKWMKNLIKADDTITRRVSTYANIANLAPAFRKMILEKYEDTRLGRQELHGELLEDVEGALWNWDMFQWVDEAPDLIRIVVAVDPAGTANLKSDETGIVVLGIGYDHNLYVLEDLTGKYSPEQWASLSNAAYERWNADAIVVEKTYGQDMVRFTLENSGYAGARIIPVDSRRGKALRAEPVVALYEKKRVFHVGNRGALSLLEDEQTTWVPGKGASPNRVDALVHGATELVKHVTPSSMANPNQLLRHLRAV